MREKPNQPILISSYSFDDYLGLIKAFHGNVAPGLVIGGFMVDLARRRLPEGLLFDAICETRACLPDAVQLLTPCTIGNGWLKVINLGRFAVNLYDKYEGDGVRVWLDPAKTAAWPEVHSWYLKLKPKAEQDKELLLAQIKEAGPEVLSWRPVRIRPHLLTRKSRGRLVICPLCREAYPAQDGGICRACQGEVPYLEDEAAAASVQAEAPSLQTVALEEAVGRRALHDMTRIIPGLSKGPAVKQGEVITVGDLCRLQQMGRHHLYVVSEDGPGPEWVHEDEAALAFARAMAGEGVTFTEPPREGKVNLVAAADGLLEVAAARLTRFNLVPGVMCASRAGYSRMAQGRPLAATRAIPLYLPRADFLKALAVLEEGPLFTILPLRQPRVGVLVTGTEVFLGLVEDKFIPIITAKVENFQGQVVKSLIVPDDREAIRRGVGELLAAGIDLLVTTAGLSVDPDDVTRQGLLEAGATDLTYGAPILPGAMTLLAWIGPLQVMGVPACALYFKTTSFDLLLPRLLADRFPSRRDLAQLGHGAFCLECKTCTFPKCPFGK
jgi:formylmethanofuran dehydrogenase subunit E